MRARPLTAALAAAVALALVLLLLPSERAGEDGDAARAPETPLPAPPPSLEGRPAGTSPEPGVPPAAPPDPASAEGALAPGTLVVEVRGGPDGATLAGAEVAVSREDATPVRTVATDAGGLARFEGLADDRVGFEARAPGHVPEVRSVSDLSKGGRRVRVDLAPGVALSGVVLAAGSLRPVAGAPVLLERGGAIEGMSVSYAGPPLARVLTDASGAFRVEGVPFGDVVTLRASAPGFVAASKSLMLGEGAAAHPAVRFELLPAASVSGRVLGADGAPAAQAEVCAVAVRDEGAAGPDEGGLARWEDRIGPWGVGVAMAGVATTDAQGAYAIDGLPAPGRYRLFARHQGAARSALTDPPLAIDEPRSFRVADLRLRRPGALAVRATGPDGADLDDVRVWIDLRGIDLVPERDGAWHVFAPMSPGRYEVFAARGGYVRGSIPAEVREGDRTEARVRLDRGVSIEGVVVDDRGQPLRDVGVAAHPESSEDGPADESGYASTDAEGRFRIDGLRPVPHALNAGGSDARVVVPAPSSGARLVVRRAGSLRLRLRAPAGAALPPRVQLSVEDLDEGGGVGGDHAVAEDGQVVAGNLTASRVRLAIVVPGYAPVVRTEAVTPGEQRDLGDVLLGPGVALTGRVVDAGGAPRPGARVRVILPSFLDDAVATAGADGTFRVQRLPVDETTFVRAEAEGCLPFSGRVALGPTGASVVLTLVPGVPVRGTVRTASGRPVPGVHVEFALQDEAPFGVPRERSETTDETGAFRVLVAPGAHAVAVVGADRVVLRPAEAVTAPREAPLVLDLAP